MNANRSTVFAVLLGAWFHATAPAADRVQLELVVEQGVPITGQQEWLGRLTRAGVENFRIRSARSGEEPGIERRGTGDLATYAVTGVITSNDFLVVPGARFSASQLGQLAEWLRDLEEYGPPDERPEKVAFGLTVEDFEQLQDDLAPPLGFPTQGLSRAAVIRQAAKGISTRLSADPRMAGPLSKDIVAEDLSTLSRGTALAYVLRSPGLCLVPDGQAGNLTLKVVEAKPNMQIWPIGWDPEQPNRDIKPEMYELRPVNVSGVPVTTVVEAITKQLEMPVLFDHNAMARYGLEPDKVIAEVKPSRSTYSIVLRKVLFQARLKGELRLDDGDRPFLWVTSLKPL